MAMTLQLTESSLMKTLRLGLLARVREKFGGSLDRDDQRLYDQLSNYVDQTLDLKKTLSRAQKSQIRQSIFDEVFGLGPLGPLLRHPHVANIYLEGLERAYVEKYGPRGSHQIQKLRLPFENDEHLLDIIHRIIRPLGCELKASAPIASGVLPNGTRVYAAMQPASVHGPTLSLVCREQSTVEVVPNWHVSFTHFDQLHEAMPESMVIDGKEINAVRISLNEFRTDACLNQSFMARAMRGKKISFCGTLQLFDDPAWEQDSELPAELASCSARGAAAYICASGRGGKRIEQGRMTLDLIDGKTQAFQCTMVVPANAVKLTAGIGLHGPIRALIADLSFSVDAPAQLRPGQGPKNLELLPDSSADAWCQ
jgi:hypothetical protein